MRRPDNCIVVIFGASGDLAKRKLLPALLNLHSQNLLPESFTVLGVGRTPMTDDAFRTHGLEGVAQHGQGRAAEPSGPREFGQRLHYEPMDPANVEHYARLEARLSALGAQYGVSGNHLYYLATPPGSYEVIVQNLGAARLNLQGADRGWKRIVIEKPFGRDLASAQALNRCLLKVFDEGQIFRIDHYLGKETVQNLLVLRFANGIFEPLWNRNYVHHVEVTSSEHIGIEGRGGYYDAAGALRDMVQNHLLQIVGFIAMEPPTSFDPEAIRNETLKVFQALRPLKPDECEHCVVRGQYLASTIRGEQVRGYREEDDVPGDSRTETYVALECFIGNWRWAGVPFLIRTGKRLPTRVTEVVVHFQQTPHRLFGTAAEPDHGRNQLVIRIQPDEGIVLRFGMKLPGAGFEVRDVTMDFRYADLAEAYVPAPYERLLLDCMLGDPTLYARRDVVEACWAFVDPILNAWESHPDLKLYGYPAGTWGPKEADDLLRRHGERWRQPCRNLARDGEYCEL